MPAPVDGVMVDTEGEMIFVYETKCRDIDLHQLREWGAYLITYDKIERGISICRSLGIDFRGFLYLVPEQILMIVKIWDYKTREDCIMKIEETRTQATVNGGSIVRLNAYVDVSNGTVIREEN